MVKRLHDPKHILRDGQDYSLLLGRILLQLQDFWGIEITSSFPLQTGCSSGIVRVSLGRGKEYCPLPAPGSSPSWYQVKDKSHGPGVPVNQGLVLPLSSNLMSWVSNQLWARHKSHQHTSFLLSPLQELPLHSLSPVFTVTINFYLLKFQLL